MVTDEGDSAPSLATALRDWGRIGCLGFGGPPAHIALLRELCVERRRWLSATQFEDAVATTNLLPGPASTQLAVFTAWRVRGAAGAIVGGLAFILPGLAAILLLAALFLGDPPLWIRGAGAGAGAAVAAVAVRAGADLLPASRRRVRAGGRVRWTTYALLGGAAAAALGPWLVLVLAGCGAFEAIRAGALRAGERLSAHGAPLLLGATLAAGGPLAALAWVAFKVGALSYGGGFVIVPLMQGDAVGRHHWMSAGEFLNAVALGQITPGPVVHTVAVVGYAAAGVGGALVAAAVAFAPSFVFVLAGARHFDRLRANAAVRAFLDGAGPAAIGAIIGSAVPLALALGEPWQYAVLAGAALALLAARRPVIATLLAAGAAGVVAALAGAAIPG